MELTLEQYVNNAIEAEQQGVPVEWKKVAVELAQASRVHIDALHATIKSLKDAGDSEE